MMPKKRLLPNARIGQRLALSQEDRQRQRQSQLLAHLYRVRPAHHG